MGDYLPEPKSSEGRVKVEQDLSNYATRQILRMQQMWLYQSLLKRVIQEA